MIIGIDLDDVLADVTTGLNVYHNNKYGTNIMLENHFDYDLSLIWQVSKEESLKRIFDYLANHSHKAKPMTDSQEILQKLASKNTFKVITSRPEGVEKQTKDWIKKHFSALDIDVHFAGAYYGANRKTKAEVCKELGAEVLIEDCLKFALECSDAGIRVLLFDMPWNQMEKLPKNIHRVHSWKEIEKILS
jgi:uncharacterized HAD superfamily protein